MLLMLLSLLFHWLWFGCWSWLLLVLWKLLLVFMFPSFGRWFRARGWKLLLALALFSHLLLRW